MIYPRDKYDLIGFEISRNRTKKYDALILPRNQRSGIIRVPFGSRIPLMQQYKDQTGLNVYSHLDHNDKVRRDNFRKRFKKLFNPSVFSATYFSWVYLW